MEAAINRLEATNRKGRTIVGMRKFFLINVRPSLTLLAILMETHESWCFGDFDQDSISTHQLELDQSQTLDKLARFDFKEIELDCECEPDPQLCDSVLVSNLC